MGSRSIESTLELLSHGTPSEPVPLGKYDVVGRLGSGGMSTVYEAIDRERGIPVALKTLSSVDAAAAVSLKREFRVVADLAHPNLAPVYELAQDRGLWFFTMERVEGVSLSRWARDDQEAATAEKAPFPLSRTLSTQRSFTQSTWGEELEDTVIEDGELYPSELEQLADPSLPAVDLADIRSAFTQLTQAIAALHDAGLRHGDVKPANVLVRPDGQVVLVDFGLARPVEELAPRLSSGGTPTYMAPEQLSDAGVGFAADWYALGATLYGMLTGWRPFLAGTKLELYLKKMHYPPPAPRTVLPDIPADLSDLCLALLRADPETRPGREVLLQVFSGDPSVEVSSERPQPIPFIGRDNELCALERAYGTARAGQLTVAHVRGPSGIGKSALLSSFLSAVHEVDSALVLRGRCYERERVPYKGFDRIIDDLSDYLRQLDDVEVEPLLPNYTAALARVFPALASVPAISRRAEEVLTEGAIELRRRAWIALGELLGAVASHHPIVLTIDDLQWSDADSAQLLVELLSIGRGMPLLFVILFRPEEAEQNPDLAAYFEACARLRADGLFLDLQVEALSSADARRLARATLARAASEEDVSFVAREAAGVPIFIEELAHFIQTTDRSHQQQITLDDAVRARVGALGPQQRTLVELVAVANSPLPQSVVFQAAGLDAGNLSVLLTLRKAALVSWRGGGADDVVSPYHDRIRESVVASLPADEQARRHLSLARALAQQKDRAGSWLFDAVRHYEASAELIVDPEERVRAAQLHAEAGTAALSTAAYPLGYACFEGGIRLLGAKAWQEHYALSLRLFGGAVETAYLSGHRSELRERCAQVKRHARDVMDQLVAWETEIDAHAGRQEYEQALHQGREVLRMLGVELLSDPTEQDVGAALQPTLARLNDLGIDGMRALPELDDARVAAITRIQVRLSPVAYFGRPLLLPIIACNLINTSIDRGLSTATPYALSLFGIVLNTLEMYPVSHAWGQLALELLERWPKDRRLEAATRHILFNLVCNWMVPLSSTLQSLREVFDIGRQTGDYEYAGFAAHGFVHNSFYAGSPLAPLKKEALWLGAQLREFGVNALHVHRPFEQLLKAMTGDLENPASLDQVGFDSQQQLVASLRADARSSVCVLSLTMGIARFHFGDAAEASELLEQARAHLDGAPSVWHPPTVHLFAALAAGRACEQSNDPEARARFRQRAEQSLPPLLRLSELNPINFAHRVSLVQAELSRLDGRRDAARAQLQQAVTQAQAGAWINDVALAYELSARCQDEPEAAKAALRAARTGYAAWGATAKAEQLSQQIAALSAA